MKSKTEEIRERVESLYIELQLTPHSVSGRRIISDIDINWLLTTIKALLESDRVCVEAGNYLDSALSGALETDEILCRADEDCDHCFAIQAGKEWTEALTKRNELMETIGE